jgi:hypothetical protein
MTDHREEKDDTGFRIVDRRRFTSEGEMREDVPDRPAAAEPVLPPRSPRPERGERGERAPKPSGDPRRARSAAAQREPSGIDFLSFVASLATNALAALGALPEAQARGLPKSPELAREYIDILAMLQQKTEGNLTADEEQALEQVLADLRLQYVEATRR